MRMLLTYFLCAGLVLLAGGCTRQGSGTDGSAAAIRKPATLFERYPTFRDALRAQPRLMVDSQGAYLRTASPGATEVNREVKFALSGQILGTLQEVENIMSLQDIERFQVLDAQTASSQYGLLGANGVVEIVPIKAFKGSGK